MKLLLLAISISFSIHSHAQFHTPVLPNLEGDDLQEALVDEYKTRTVLTYGEARDTFMQLLDLVDGKLSCVYSGYQVNINPGDDPTTVAFAQGINTEHTIPRSKGASENTLGHSDMHHLFPTKENINSDRGSLPFGEVPDNQTDKWYLDNNVQTNIPAFDIDDYSELLEGQRFEPREQHKGDVARAYFYFYTMYEIETSIADATFLDIQIEDMCNWHFADPVDEKEWLRSKGIAFYQEGKENPFVLDCRLARLYCPEIQGACLTVDTEETLTDEISIFPNPATESFQINGAAKKQVSIYNQQSQLIIEIAKVDENQLIDISSLPRGVYIVKIQAEQSRKSEEIKLLKL